MTATTHFHTSISNETTTPSRAASIATTLAEDTVSIAASANTAVEEEDGQQTPRALSLAPTLVGSRTTYRGFPSEAAYLAAFHEWAESKRYVQQDDTTLVGYYGTTNMEFASRPRVEFGLSRKWRERKEKKQQRQQQQARRRTVV